MASIFSSKSLARFRRHHLQRVIHTIEVVEQPRHCRNLDDLSFVVVPAKAREQRVVDAEGIDRQLLRVGQRRFLFLIERTALEIEDLLELLIGCPMPRSLRGV